MSKLLIINTYSCYIGGVERYISQVAHTLKKEGWTLFGLFEKRCERDDGFLEVFDKVFYDDPKTRNNLFNMLKDAGVQVAFIHKIEAPDLMKQVSSQFKVISVIHDHDYYCPRKHKYYAYRRINCRRPFNKFFCTLCSLGIERAPNGLFPFKRMDISHKSMLLKAVRKADRTIVLSEFMRNNLIKNGWNPGHIRKIYPIQKLYDPPMRKKNEAIRLLYVGQLIRGKGVDLLLRCLEHVNLPFKADIIGTGNDEIYIRRLIIKYGLHDKVNLIGWANDVAPFYQAADIVLVPSRWQEPFGLIGAEAFAHGKPVVAFDVGGISEWLKDGVNGYLVKAKHVQAMAKRIQELMTNFDEMLIFGENGYKMIAEHYTSQRFLQQFKEIITEMESDS